MKNSVPSPKHLLATGLYLPIANNNFDANLPYTCCRICGVVFQHGEPNPDLNTTIRQAWSLRHANTHSEQEHRLLRLSGAWCTPEAAQILAGYGIISLTDLVLSEAHSAAYAEAPRAPQTEPIGKLSHMS